MLNDYSHISVMNIDRKSELRESFPAQDFLYEIIQPSRNLKPRGFFRRSAFVFAWREKRSAFSGHEPRSINQSRGRIQVPREISSLPIPYAFSRRARGTRGGHVACARAISRRSYSFVSSSRRRHLVSP